MIARIRRLRSGTVALVRLRGGPLRTIARRVQFVALVLAGRLLNRLPVPEPHRTQARRVIAGQLVLLAFRDSATRARGAR